MKIVYVTNYDWFFISHRLPLAERALQEGHEVYLLSIDTGRRAELESKGIHFVPIPLDPTGTNPLEALRCSFFLARQYRKIKPDLVHHITIKVVLLGCIASKISRQKGVVNAISGMGYLFTDGRDGLLQKVVKLAMKFAFKSRNFSFILQNPDDFNAIKSMNYVPEDQVHLIKGSGIDLNDFMFTPQPENSVLEILFPARILRDKGVIELIEAANLLREKLKGKVKFILAGDCTCTNPTAISESELSRLLEDNYIEWVGYQSEMKSLYQKSDIVVLPSYREGLPKSLIEACAIGRPIVTCDVPGCRECVHNGENGFLVTVKDARALADAILKLVQSPVLRHEFGQASRKLAEREFSIAYVVDKHFDIYRGISNREV